MDKWCNLVPELSAFCILLELRMTKVLVTVGAIRHYETCKAPVKLSPPTNQHPLRPDALPVA